MAVTLDAVGPTGTAGVSGTTSPLQWTHTCAAGATELLVGVMVDSSSDAAITVAVTYNSLSMSSVLRWESGGSTESAGFVQVFAMPNPSSGANQVSATISAGSGFSGGSLSFLGSTGISGATHADSNAAVATSGTISVPTTSASNIAAVFMCDGSGSIAFTAGTSRFITGGVGFSGAAAYEGCATAPGTGSPVVVSWTQNSDWWAAIGVEVQAGGGAVLGGKQRVIRQAVKRASLW